MATCGFFIPTIKFLITASKFYIATVEFLTPAFNFFQLRFPLHHEAPQQQFGRVGVLHRGEARRDNAGACEVRESAVVPACSRIGPRVGDARQQRT